MIDKIHCSMNILIKLLDDLPVHLLRYHGHRVTCDADARLICNQIKSQVHLITRYMDLYSFIHGWSL